MFTTSFHYLHREEMDESGQANEIFIGEDKQKSQARLNHHAWLLTFT